MDNSLVSSYTDKKTKLIFTAVVVVFLIIVGAAIWIRLARTTTKISNVIELPATQLPPNLPTNLPEDDSAKAESNKMTLYEGLVVGRRTYQSDKSVAENVKIYKEYLKSQGYEVISDVAGNTESFVRMYTSKLQPQAQVVIKAAENGQGSTVTVAYGNRL